jgi:hypothetical protein
MRERRQLSSMDAETLARQSLAGTASARSEEEALQWLANEYGLAYASLEKADPDRALHVGHALARLADGGAPSTDDEVIR